MHKFNTPVLLILFNRPEATRQLLNVLSQIKPSILFVSVDGPRYNFVHDNKLCSEVREIIIQINWPCELHTLFHDENLGCGKAPSTAISWFFEHVENGIILEDDSIPHVDFFQYCAELLILYKNDHRVKVIGSANFQDKMYGDGSYYFSMQNGCFCSWATWRRTWCEYDYYLTRINNTLFKRILNRYKVSLKEYIYWIDIFNHVKRNRFNDSCWDYQLMFSIWRSNGVGIVPNVNLATNIGFNLSGTHTFDPDHQGANKPSVGILPIIHPKLNQIQREADLFYHNYYYQVPTKGTEFLLANIVIVNKWIKSLFNVNQSWKKQLKYSLKSIFLHLASTKSDIKNWYYWNKRKKKLKNQIINYYSGLFDEIISEEEKKICSFLQEKTFSMMPYDFIESYSPIDTTVIYDIDQDLNYVLYNNYRLYYRRGWSKNKIKKYHSHLLSEQDHRSPHCYMTDSFFVDAGSTLLDAGAAEGIFTLLNINSVKHAYLIEPDSYWVEALKATFSPWSDKVTIIDKYIGTIDNEEKISVDYINQISGLDFLKIDVEGWERDVLEGAQRTLSEGKPMKIVIATYHKQNDEITLYTRLTSFGFQSSYSKGYVAYAYDTDNEPPYLRRCLIRACR